MVACPHCTLPNPDAAVFCSRCGAELPRAPVAAGSTQRAEPVVGAFAQGPERSPANASPLPAPAPGFVGRLHQGEVVDGKYSIERTLGEGGMGIVYLARDINTDAFVVVKAIQGNLAHKPEFRDRIRAEGRALARIDHPSVVRLNAVVLEQGAVYLVMQYVEGPSLDRIIGSYVARATPMPFGEAMAIFRQMVAGVGAAHREGVVHRDIKPGNILVRAKDGVAKVTDFGIAKEEADAKAGRGPTQGIIGSLWYMAPEQVVGRRDLDKRLDIYALGVVLFEMLTGRVPFDSPSDYAIMKMHTEAPLPLVHLERSDVPAAIDEVLARACAKDRELRFASCEELLAALDRALSPPAPPAPASFAPARIDPLEPPTDPRATHAPPSAPSAPSAPAAPPDEPAAGLPGRGRLALIAALAAAALVAAGLVWGSQTGVLGGAAAPVASPPRPALSDAAAPPPSGQPAGALERLAALGGRWVSDSDHHYDAVLSGDVLEFRVRDAREFPRQNYQAGEPRFTLRAVDARAHFSVEDKIRPEAPSNTSYAPSSRTTCQEVWTEVKGAPLEARSDGKQLSVDLVKMTPDLSSFDIRGSQVLDCHRLASATVDRVSSTLRRE